MPNETSEFDAFEELEKVNEGKPCIVPHTGETIEDRGQGNLDPHETNEQLARKNAAIFRNVFRIE